MAKNKYNIDLNLKEYCLILAIRHEFPFGDIEIVAREGSPQYIRQAWKSDSLDNPDKFDKE